MLYGVVLENWSFWLKKKQFMLHLVSCLCWGYLDMPISFTPIIALLSSEDLSLTFPVFNLIFMINTTIYQLTIWGSCYISVFNSGFQIAIN